MSNAEIWDEAAVAAYDMPGRGMFAPSVLERVVARLADLARGGRALEFAFGTGRVALLLQAKGGAVAGVEIAPALLAQQRTKVSEADLPVALGDRVTARISGDFALVFRMFNGMSKVVTQAERVDIGQSAARQLGPGGRFVMGLRVPDLPHPTGPQAVVGTAEPWYLQGDICNRVAQVVRTRHRHFWPSKLDLMGQWAGFVLESRQADWAGGAFAGALRSHVPVCRRGRT